jgi:lysophospholipase L1-like esterase
MRRFRDTASVIGSLMLAISGCSSTTNDDGQDADLSVPQDAGGVGPGDAGGMVTGDAGGANDAGGGGRTAVAYTGSAAPKTATAGLLNIGQQFEVTAPRITIRDLGFWDEGADGLVAPHVVSLFALDKLGDGAMGSPIAGGSVTVPAGMAAPFEQGFRFAPLAAPLTLIQGKYAVIAYGMNVNDDYGEGGNVPLSSSGIRHGNYSSWQFVDVASPAFPTGGNAGTFACASFRYDAVGPDYVRIMPMGDSITDGSWGTHGGYRGPLADLLTSANIRFQFVGSSFDNRGDLPGDQWHHEGHPGWVIKAGTSGRSGLQDHIGEWLGAGGTQPDIILLMIGTNDVDISYDLANAESRLSTLISTILDRKYGLRPQAKMIIAQIVPIQDAVEDARVTTYNQSVAKVVAAHAKLGEHISLLDMHAALQASDFHDKLHPNDAGYVKMAKVWFPAIQSLRVHDEVARFRIANSAALSSFDREAMKGGGSESRSSSLTLKR